MATAVEAKRLTSRQLPPVSRTFGWCFHQYLPRYVGKSFHTVSLLKRDGSACPKVAGGPLIVALNHPSWWDPLMGLLINRHCFPDRQFRAPIDAAMLQRYGIFRSLGFFGVEQQSVAGAREFLSVGAAVAASGADVLWVPPEGRFADVRDDAEFEPGLGHLLSKLDHGTLLVLAAEYPFWEERLPEALAAFGVPIVIGDHVGLDKNGWTDIVRRQLRETQSELAAASIARDVGAFEPLLSGGAGVGGFYDLARRFKDWARLRRFHPEHGRKFND